MKQIKVRFIIGLVSCIGLLCMFLFQRIDFAEIIFKLQDELTRFLVNKSFRFIVNDFLMLALIYSLFYDRKYVVFAFWVQLAGLFFLLLPYFIFKIYYPAYNGPMINFLHRIILNPILMLLLLPAFYYQKQQQTTGRTN